jgi:small subunit ribosomal protein S16
MAVCIRLSRVGRLHRPFYRVVAIDKRCHREGKTNEILGVYDPLLKSKGIQVDAERLAAWVARGAQVSEAVSTLLKHDGYTVPGAAVPPTPASPSTAAKALPAKGVKQPWTKPSRRARLKHQASLKAARKAGAAAAAPAPAADAPKA